MHLPFARFLVPVACFGGAVVACSSSSTPATKGNVATLAANSHAVASVPMNVTVDKKTGLASSVTFPAGTEVQNFKVGDVIASSTRTDTPYLGSITSVENGGGTVTFKLAPASLTDLFTDIQFSQTIPMSDMANALSGTQSVTGGRLHTDGLTGPPAGGLKEWDLGDDGNKGTIQAGGSASLDMSKSTFSYAGGVEFNVDYGLVRGLTDLKLAATGSITAHIDANATVTAECNYTTPESEWYQGTVAVFWFQIGPVPVPIQMEISFADSGNVDVEGEFEFHTGTTATISIEEGAEYTNGGWQVINNPSFTMKNDPVTLTGKDGTVALTFYPMSATVALKPFAVGGPTLDISPYLGVSGSYGTEGKSIDGSVGIELEVGGEVNILHHDLGMFAYPLATISKDFNLWKSGEDAGGGGSSTTGGSNGSGASTATGSSGSTDTASGASTDTASGGSTDTASGGSTDTASGGSTDTASGGSTDTASGGSTGTSSGGSSDTGSGGSSDTGSGGSSDTGSGGSSDTGSGGSSTTGSSGSADTSSTSATGGGSTASSTSASQATGSSSATSG